MELLGIEPKTIKTKPVSFNRYTTLNTTTRRVSFHFNDFLQVFEDHLKPKKKKKSFCILKKYDIYFT